MKATKRLVTLVVAVGALGLGALVVTVPAVAGGNPFGPAAATAANPGPRPGGNGTGMTGGAGSGIAARDGSCLTPPASGTLSDQQKATMAAVAQEQKLSQDLYAAFAARYELAVFDRIAAAETQHLTAVRTLLDRYGLTDPTAGKPAGQFSDPAVQASYDRLLAQGQASQADALTVAPQIEQRAIDTLRAGQDGLTAPDVQRVYTQLLAAEQQHVTAFQRWS
jgi:hypothetical protein